MANKITVLLYEPHQAPRMVDIDNSLKAMQDVVGGDIEVLSPWSNDVVIVCNEEGKLRGLEPNCVVRFYRDNAATSHYEIICGTFFVAQAPIFSDGFDSLPEDNAEAVQAFIQTLI